MSKTQTITTTSEAETESAARSLAAKLQGNEVITLQGNLGMGKTVFARALIRALSGDETLEVPSPTFTLVQTYDSDKGAISHFDCYRLEEAEEIFELGWEEALTDGIVLLEWPERISPFLPQRRLDITISALHNNPDHRRIDIIRVE